MTISSQSVLNRGPLPDGGIQNSRFGSVKSRLGPWPPHARAFLLTSPHPSGSLWARTESSEGSRRAEGNPILGAGWSIRRAPGVPGHSPPGTPGCGGHGGWRLSAHYLFRVMSWIFWGLVSLRRQPGKVRAWVLPRCRSNSKRPKTKLRRVAHAPGNSLGCCGQSRRSAPRL